MPPAWVIGMTNLPFGLVAGFCVTALPFLLTKIGVSVDQVATISATVMSPSFWAFLVTPLVDVGLTRRTWAVLTALLSACSLGMAVWELSPDHLVLFAGLLLLAELAIVLYGSALTGWQACFLPDTLRGKVSGWNNAANLGGGAFGAMIFLEMAEAIPLRTAGLVFACLCFLPVFLLPFMPAPGKPGFEIQRVFTQTWRKVWESCRRRECLVGFALFLSPASCAAAINLFSGLGKDFQTQPQRVIWVTGAGCAITSALGSVLGGFLADRVHRGRLYLCAGIAASVCGLCMAFAAHTATTFTLGVLAYNASAGACYAAFSALGFQLVGKDNPVASTLLGLFAAMINGAIVYMTWFDGVGYRFFGATGLLCVDAGMSLLAAIPLFWLVRFALQPARPAFATQGKQLSIGESTMPSV
jgi:PAT family beta-lactamase induction signal transducer AmpG